MNLRTEKYCGKCRVAKPRSEFNKHSISKDGLRNDCRSCQKYYAEKYRVSHPKTPEQLVEQRIYSKQYRIAKHTLINERRKVARREQQRILSIRMRFVGNN